MGMRWDEVEKLNVGDEVAVDVGGRHRTSFVFTKVAKITPTGRINLANGRKFNKNGRELGGSSWYPAHLWDAEEARKRQEEDNRFEALKAKFREIRDGDLKDVWEDIDHAARHRSADNVDRKELARKLREVAAQIEAF